MCGAPCVSSNGPLVNVTKSAVVGVTKYAVREKSGRRWK